MNHDTPPLEVKGDPPNMGESSSSSSTLIGGEEGVSIIAPSPLHLDVNNRNTSTAATQNRFLLRKDVVVVAVNENEWYHTYATTTTLIVILHLLFCYHWFREKKRSRVLVNYRSIIQRKKYAKALVALLSHPPADDNWNQWRRRRRRRHHYSPPPLPEEAETLSLIQLYHSFRPAEFRQALAERYPLVFATTKPWNSFPFLLCYNAHILWSVRALEVEVGSHHDNGNDASSLPYARLLWALSLVGYGMDFGLSYGNLILFRHRQHGTSSPMEDFPSTSDTTSNLEYTASMSDAIRRPPEGLFTQRSFCGLTVTTTALLLLFRDAFPYAPIPILPLLDTTQLPILSIPALSFVCCWGILFCFSASTHAMYGVVCGSISGMMWGSGYTSFLMEPYWSNCTVLLYAMLCLMSWKAQGSPWVPCIDHIGWDRKGHIIRRHPLISVFAAVRADDRPNSPDDDERSTGSGSSSDSSSNSSSHSDDHDDDMNDSGNDDDGLDVEMPPHRDRLRHRGPVGGASNNDDNNHDATDDDERFADESSIPLLNSLMNANRRSHRN